MYPPRQPTVVHARPPALVRVERARGVCVGHPLDKRPQRPVPPCWCAVHRRYGSDCVFTTDLSTSACVVVATRVIYQACITGVP